MKLNAGTLVTRLNEIQGSTKKKYKDPIRSQDKDY